MHMFLSSLFSLSSLKSRILFNILLFTTIPIFIGTIYIFMLTKDNITKEYQVTVEKNFMKCVELINQEMTNYMDKSNYIFTNKYLISAFQKDYKEDIEEMLNFYDNIKMFGSGLESPDYEGQDPFTIYIYNDTLFEGKYVEQIERIKNQSYFNKVSQAPATDIFWSPALGKKDKALFLSFYRNLNLFSQPIGILEFNVPFKKIKYYMKFIATPDKGIIFYKNTAGAIIYSNGQLGSSIQESDLMDKDNYLTISKKLVSGDEIMVYAPLSSINKKIRLASIEIFGIFIIIILGVLYASNVTSKKISSRLNTFINKLKSNNDLLLNEEMIEISGNDEISIIQQKFKNVIGQMNRTYKESLTIKKHNAALEIELLHSRINPHMLYNSLSVMKWPALRNKDMKTVEMIDAMTKYYRMALNKENNIIRISSELEMIREYVKINECSRSQTYELEIHMENSIADCYTFKHLLQPIVENAIVHGLNGIENHAKLVINGYYSGSQIIIEVIDNGHGMDKHKIDSIINLNYSPLYGGYGLRNVIKGIQGYYGIEYGIKIESSIRHGTKVIVTIAALDKDELIGKTYHM